MELWIGWQPRVCGDNPDKAMNKWLKQKGMIKWWFFPNRRCFWQIQSGIPMMWMKASTSSLTRPPRKQGKAKRSITNGWKRQPKSNCVDPAHAGMIWSKNTRVEGYYIDKKVISVKKHRTLASWLLIIFQTVFGIILGAPWLILGLFLAYSWLMLSLSSWVAQSILFPLIPL